MARACPDGRPCPSPAALCVGTNNPHLCGVIDPAARERINATLRPPPPDEPIDPRVLSCRASAPPVDAPDPSCGCGGTVRCPKEPRVVGWADCLACEEPVAG